MASGRGGRHFGPLSRPANLIFKLQGDNIPFLPVCPCLLNLRVFITVLILCGIQHDVIAQHSVGGDSSEKRVPDEKEGEDVLQKGEVCVGKRELVCQGKSSYFFLGRIQ